MTEPQLERLTRSEARLRFGNRVVTVYGEGHLPVEGSSGWVIYSASIEKWEGGSPVLEHERSAIVEALAKAFQHRSMKYTID